MSLSPATQALLAAEDEGGSQAELKRIAQRLLELEAEIRIVKTHYNTKLPIARLPSEVLCEIFVFVTLVEEPERETLSRFLVGQVCKRWRKVALDCTELWADISFDRSRGVIEAMIARARDAPVSIHNFAPDDNPSTVDLFYSLISQTHRLRAVTITCEHTEHCWFPEMLGSFASTAPVLEELSLGCDHEQHDSPVPPTGFLDGGAPLLTSLEMHPFARLPWSAIPFSARLTHLSLGCNPFFDRDHPPESCRPSLRSFLLSFATTSNLRVVRLIGYLPDASEPRQPLEFELPPWRHLEKLTMCDSILNLNSVIPFLRLARRTEFNLVITDEAKHEYIHYLLHALWLLKAEDDTRWIGKAELSHLLIAMPDFDESSFQHVHFWVTGDAEPSLPSKLKLSFTGDDPSEGILSAMIGVSASSQGQFQHDWNFSTTTSLDFCGNPRGARSAHTLFDLFGTQLPNLRKITFRNCSLAFYQFLSILELAHEFSQPPFPSLTHVECIDMGFHHPNTVTSTLSALQARAVKFARPIQELRCERSAPLNWPNLRDWPQQIPDTRIICDGYPTFEAFPQGAPPMDRDAPTF
ncbi:hypothetical protein NMY22_g1773 [Coprinellus aureogranulatus]|nr:hypothetical protein NMY22_g1773 [Coprinellus aureogranulatus]